MRPKKNISTLKLHHHKHTAASQSVRIAPPKEVLLPMTMHAGAPAEPIVAVGDYVRVGQKIAERGEKGFSSPVHATVSGTVTAIEPYTQADGRSVQIIRIESDGKMEKDPAIKPPVANDVEEFLEVVAESGIVGLGGAAFPLWGKLAAVRRNQIDTVLINGAECEPYITSDHRMMVEHSDLIVKGVEILRKWMKSKRFVIGIEDNKPDAIAKLREAFAGDTSVEVLPLPSIYPQGAKQVLLYNVTGQVVKGGQRMASLGVIIINVSSTAKMAQYMETGMPLVTKRLTVEGDIVKEPKNVEVVIGTPIQELLDFCGGLTDEPGKVLYGGPMMGNCVADLSQPILKNNNAIMAFSKKWGHLPKETNCIHCGRCTNACPLGLSAKEIVQAYQVGDVALLQELNADLCMSCGTCSFVCPAKRPLAPSIALAKIMMKNGGKK